MTTQNDGYWHITNEAMAGFMSVLSCAVALQDVLPDVPGESRPETLRKSLHRCQDTLVIEAETLTLDDETLIRTLVGLFDQAVQSGASVFTPNHG